MCCLFGLIDVKHQLPGAEKNRIISILAETSEARGTDATGYACNSHGKLIIEKQPLPAHRMKFQIPRDSYIVMGHTRLTTQGGAQKNKNNHPFLGKTNGMPFALAPNGVLTNDTVLRKSLCLPKTNIETDSYIAVQLLEQQATGLVPEGLKRRLEQLKKQQSGLREMRALGDISREEFQQDSGSMHPACSCSPASAPWNCGHSGLM